MVLSDRAGPRGADDLWREEFVLLDRRTERAAIDRVVDAGRGGLSGTLVLRGPPGVGKSTLLEYAAAGRAPGRVRTGRRICAGAVPGGLGGADSALPGG